jgi:hypothetical protein
MTTKFQFEEFKAALKDKWLEYYESNCHWINDAMNRNSYWYSSTSDSYRPESRFMLGILAVLEPGLAEVLATLIQLNSDPTALVKSLGLDFVPDTELRIRAEIKSRIQAIETIPLLPESDAEYLNKIRQENIT